jgi:penicillin-binding protein 1A
MALPIFGLYMQKVYGDSTIGLPKDHFPIPQGFDVELDCGKFDYSKQNLHNDTLGTSTNSVLNPDND